MATIGLITMHDIANYGSCLQTYATQEVFKSLGWSTLVVDYRRPNNTLEHLAEQVFRGRRLAWLEPLWRVAPALKRAAALPVSSYIRQYFAPFKRFRRAYLHESAETYLTYGELEKNPPAADVYCTGSDQVWNSVWNEGFDRAYYLTWVPQGKPRIAYSASIGREAVDEWEKEPMRRALREYSAISMREASGVKILSNMGVDAHLVIDPTLMLERSDWARIATWPKGVGGNYILVYQLNPSDDFSGYANRAAKTLGLPLVKLCYKGGGRQKGAKNIVSPEVTDFIGLFLNADFVITDSFHATAFALNFEKRFVAIPPNRFSTRIRNILKLTGTADRLLVDFDNIDLVNYPIDFDGVRLSLEAKRTDSLNFLRKALSVVESPEQKEASIGARSV